MYGQVIRVFVLILFCFVTQISNSQQIVKSRYIEARNIDAFHVDQNGNLFSLIKFERNLANIKTDTGLVQLNFPTREGIGILKQNIHGDFLWIKHITLNIHDTYGGDLTTDVDGNIYIFSTFTYKVDFDPDPIDTSFLTANNYAFFVLKLDKNGEFKWVKKIDAFSPEAIKTFINNQNELTLIGRFRGGADFDPDTSVYTNPSVAYESPFILRWDTSANFLDFKQIGTHIRVNDVRTDNNDNIIITGLFGSANDFDPDTVATDLLPVKSHSNAYLAKYDPTGSLIWVNQLVTKSEPHSLSIDSLNNYFIYGRGGDPGDTFNFNYGSNNPSAIYIFSQEENYACQYSDSGVVQNVNIMPFSSGGLTSVTPGEFGTHYISSWEITGGHWTYSQYCKIDNHANMLWCGGFSTYNSNSRIQFMEFLNPDTLLLVGHSKDNIGNHTNPGVFYLFISDLTVDIEEEHNEINTVKLYPNPVDELINIKSTNRVNEVKVYNLQGNLIKTSYSDRINVSKLTTGLYIAHIRTSKNIEVIKFVKK